MQAHVPAYTVDAPKRYKLILFNFFISNGDAPFKNFSLIETPLGDFKLSPAYDLLNSRIHSQDRALCMSEGLHPKSEAKRKIAGQFTILGERAEIAKRQLDAIFEELTAKEKEVATLIDA